MPRLPSAEARGALVQPFADDACVAQRPCRGLTCPPLWYAQPTSDKRERCACECVRKPPQRSPSLHTTNASETAPPALLHQAWKTRRVESMATPIAACVRSWREVNPWLRQHVFDDNRSALFVRRHYPQWASLYFDGLQRVVERMDVFRYLVVHHYGGWWADVDGARTSVPLCQAPAERRARLALLQRTPCAR